MVESEKNTTPELRDKSPRNFTVVKPVRKASDARRATVDERKRTPVVRCSESGKRNKADEPFSRASPHLEKF